MKTRMAFKEFCRSYYQGLELARARVAEVGSAADGAVNAGKQAISRGNLFQALWQTIRLFNFQSIVLSIFSLCASALNTMQPCVQPIHKTTAKFLTACAGFSQDNSKQISFFDESFGARIEINFMCVIVEACFIK